MMRKSEEENVLILYRCQANLSTAVSGYVEISREYAPRSIELLETAFYDSATVGETVVRLGDLLFHQARDDAACYYVGDDRFRRVRLRDGDLEALLREWSEREREFLMKREQGKYL